MNYKIYNFALSEVANYTDRDAFVSDLALSYIWGDAEDAVDIPPERIDELGMIWDAYHRTVKDIAGGAGMSVRQLSVRFGIPQRTMESWASNSASGRSAPTYVMLMMQEAIGLLPEITI